MILTKVRVLYFRYVNDRQLAFEIWNSQVIRKHPCHQKLWISPHWAMHDLCTDGYIISLSCLSVCERAAAWPKQAGGRRVRVFLIRFSKLFCVIESWLSFCYMVCGRYFQRLYFVAKPIITVLWGFHQHSCVFKCVPLTKRKKKREKTKQNRDIYLKWELLWHEECFYFITFRRKLTRKTFAGKEDIRVFL